MIEEKLYEIVKAFSGNEQYKDFADLSAEEVVTALSTILGIEKSDLNIEGTLPEIAATPGGAILFKEMCCFDMVSRIKAAPSVEGRFVEDMMESLKLVKGWAKALDSGDYSFVVDDFGRFRFLHVWLETTPREALERHRGYFNRLLALVECE